jgi:hypothetical protein
MLRLRTKTAIPPCVSLAWCFYYRFNFTLHSPFSAYITLMQYSNRGRPAIRAVRSYFVSSLLQTATLRSALRQALTCVRTVCTLNVFVTNRLSILMASCQRHIVVDVLAALWWWQMASAIMFRVRPGMSPHLEIGLHTAWRATLNCCQWRVSRGDLLFRNTEQLSEIKSV